MKTMIGLSQSQNVYRCRIAGIVLRALLIFCALPMTGLCSELVADHKLRFRKIVGDKRVVPENKSKFLVVHDSTGGHFNDLYVDRNPSFEVPPTDIDTIEVERVRALGGRKEENHYKATITFSPATRSRFATFANANERQAYVISLGNKHLGAARGS